jgi:hypothetical protein
VGLVVWRAVLLCADNPCIVTCMVWLLFLWEKGGDRGRVRMRDAEGYGVWLVFFGHFFIFLCACLARSPLSV